MHNVLGYFKNSVNEDDEPDENQIVKEDNKKLSMNTHNHTQPYYILWRSPSPM